MSKFWKSNAELSVNPHLKCLSNLLKHGPYFKLRYFCMELVIYRSDSAEWLGTST